MNAAAIKKTERAVRDKQYWDTYYQHDLATHVPSSFARDVAARYITSGKKLLELGCGNGRDSLHFIENGLSVVAIDQAASAIQMLKNQHSQTNACFYEDDFVLSPHLKEEAFDFVYSRFTLHSIHEDQQVILLKRVYNTLKPGGLFFIEARSIQDDIFGKGICVGRNAYIYGEHYRRFLVLEELIEALEQEGFQLAESQQQRGLAPFHGEDPVVIRVIARK